MFLFLKLYLAHLIGDFILQFEELYQLKVRRFAGHIWHVVIHAVVSALLVIPYLDSPFMWAFILIISTIHLGQDLVKYTLQKKAPAYRCPLFVLDQIGHVFVVGSILLFPISREVRGFPGHTGLDFYYGSNILTLLAIAFILSTFGAAYLMHSLRTTYFPDDRHDHYITRFEMLHGLVERTVITGAFLFSSNPLVWAASLAVGVLRLFSPRLRNGVDFLLSFALAAVTGYVFSYWI